MSKQVRSYHSYVGISFVGLPIADRSRYEKRGRDCLEKSWKVSKMLVLSIRTPTILIIAALRRCSLCQVQYARQQERHHTVFSFSTLAKNAVDAVC